MMLVYARLYGESIAVIMLQLVAANALELDDRMLAWQTSAVKGPRKYHGRLLPITRAFATNDSIIQRGNPLSFVFLHVHRQCFCWPQLEVPCR